MQYAESHGIDFVFVAETWFLQWNTVAASAYFIRSTADLTQNNHSRHQAGLALFAHPRNHRRVQVHGCTAFSILVSIDDVPLSAVYFPPRLSLQEIRVEFNFPANAPKPHMIIGDINVRYGVTYGDTQATAPERRQIIANNTSILGQTHIRPTSGQTKVDHVFARPELAVKWKYQDSPVEWHTPDHNAMIILFAGHLNNAAPKLKVPVRRFRVTELEKPMVSEALVAQYDILSDKILKALNDLEVGCQKAMIRTNLQAIVDEVYSSIVSTIASAAESVIGTYIVSEAKELPDNLLSSIQNKDVSTSDAIRVFKRSQRVNGPTLMVSRDPHVTPSADAFEFYRQVYQSINEQPQQPELAGHGGLDILSDCFTKAAITSFFDNYSLARSCGQDGLHTRLLRPLMKSSLSQHLSRLFKLFAKSTVTPHSWNISTVFPIPKIATARVVSDFRPVALTLMFRRCFESLLLSRFNFCPAIKDTLELNFTQGGFQRRQSCIQLLLSSHDQHLIERGDQIFIDLKQAYDRVNLCILKRKLVARKVPEQVVLTLMSLFTRCKTRILVNGELTDTLELWTGLFQGSILSPLLWNLYVDDLADELSGRIPVKNPRARFFADDLKLQYGHMRSNNCKQQDLDKVFRWTLANNMLAGINKCAIVKRVADDGLVLRLGADILPVQDTYKYLGMENDRTGVAFNTFIERSYAKANNVLKAVADRDEWRADIKVAIFKTFIRSRMEYAAGLVWIFILSQLQKVTGVGKQQEVQDQYLRRYNELHMSALCWIVSSQLGGTINPRNICASLAGLAAPEDRLSDLAALLSGHCDASPLCTPISQQWNAQSFPASPTLLQPYTRRHPLALAHRQQNKAAAEPVSLKTFIRKNRLKVMRSATYGKMATYATAKCRSSGGMDYLLTLKRKDRSRIDFILYKQALAWRRCRFSPHLRCTSCDQPFTRRHTHNDEVSEQFPHWYRQVVRERISENNDQLHLLDSLLNNREYDAFAEVFTWLTSVDKAPSIKRLRAPQDQPQTFSKRSKRRFAEDNI